VLNRANNLSIELAHDVGDVPPRREGRARVPPRSDEAGVGRYM
jgi:hypothetical protein